MAFNVRFVLNNIISNPISGDLSPISPSPLPSNFTDLGPGTQLFPYAVGQPYNPIPSENPLNVAKINYGAMPTDVAPSTNSLNYPSPENIPGFSSGSINYPVPFSDGIAGLGDQAMGPTPLDAGPSTMDTQFTTANLTTQGTNGSALQQFISQVKNRDFAFESKYIVTFPINVGGRNLDAGNMTGDAVRLYCDSATLPGVSHIVKPFHIYGPDFHRPIDVSYGGENISFTFLVDQDFNLRKFFDSWISLINNPISFTFNYPSDYLSSGIVVKQLKKRGQDLAEGKDVGVFSIRLIDAFPITVSPMPLAYGSNAIHRLQVTFAYARWISIYGDGEPPTQYLTQDKGGDNSSSNQVIPPNYSTH